MELISWPPYFCFALNRRDDSNENMIPNVVNSLISNRNYIIINGANLKFDYGRKFTFNFMVYMVIIHAELLSSIFFPTLLAG